jgi:hypothetical protein
LKLKLWQQTDVGASLFISPPPCPIFYRRRRCYACRRFIAFVSKSHCF